VSGRQAGREIAFWYEFGSTYSYLTASRIEDVAGAAGIAVRWRPFLLEPIFAKLGWNDSPFNLQPAKGRYMWRDMERLSASYGLPFRRPSVFPRNGLLAARIAILAEVEGWCPDWTRAVFAANFAQDADIAETSVLAGLLEVLGQDAGRVLGEADTAANKERLRAQTAEAEATGIFGAPSLVVGGELYWGNDRLGDAIARAALGA
jgi:2-hydroxychromene-2-carboxylate isomerase